MTYTDIQGWFSEEAFYSRMVAEAAEGALFVEVGCWMGKSTCYLGQEIQKSGKKIGLVAVDTWQGTASEPALLAEVERCGGSVLHLFMDHMDRAGLLSIVQPLVGKSAEAPALFPDKSVDFVFIDADHAYDSVRADILAWLPKVKPGGTLSGHDWNVYEDVRRAVNETLWGAFITEGNCWIHRRQVWKLMPASAP